MDDFAHRLIDWHLKYGRHDLPWQQTGKPHPNPYEVWVSEVMLQQTQVVTVIGYFNRFMVSFPTVAALAAAEWDAVAAHWAGLGYYARARNLHASAQVVAKTGYPTDLAGWEALKGIGRSTAGAIRAMGQGAYGVILDGNVKRVLTRHAAVSDDITKAATLNELWALADTLTPRHDSGVYAQAMMDLGATLCTRKSPSCTSCPLSGDCKAYALGKQARFPFKPKKAAKPTRQAQVVILQYQDDDKAKWLWLKRPANGLWGGLWCLPILEKVPEVLLSILPNPTATHAPIKHTFTHFHWLLEPCVYTLNDVQKRAVDKLLLQGEEGDEGGLGELGQHQAYEWLGLDDVADKGKPKAMDKVIQTIYTA